MELKITKSKVSLNNDIVMIFKIIHMPNVVRSIYIQFIITKKLAA